MNKIRKILCLMLASVMIAASSLSFFANANTYVYVEISSSSINVGETAYVSASVSGDVISVSWSSSNPQIATVNANGVVTGVAGGTTTIIADPPDSISTDTYVVGVTVTDDTGIVEGEEYFIMSANSKRLLSLSSSSDSHGNTIVTSSRTNSSIKKWRVNETSDGIYAFESLYSTTGKSIGVYSDMSVILFSSPSSPFSDFEIIRATIYGQDLDGLYLIKQGEYYLGSNSSGSVYVTTTPNINCFWSFFRVDKREADLYYFYFPDSSRDSGYYDTSTNVSQYTTTMNNIGYRPYSFKNWNPRGALNSMVLNDDIFIFRGHGNSGFIAFYNDSGTSTGHLVCSTRYTNSSHANVNSLPTNALASVRCVMYIGCKTGISYNGANLVDETFARGAHFVFGATQVVVTEDNDEWLKLFLEELNSGKNIETALENATDSKNTTTIVLTTSSGSEYTTEYPGYPSYYVGDIKQYLS